MRTLSLYDVIAAVTTLNGGAVDVLAPVLDDAVVVDLGAAFLGGDVALIEDFFGAGDATPEPSRRNASPDALLQRSQS